MELFVLSIYLSEIMSAAPANPEFSRSQAAEIVKRLYGLSPTEMGPLPSYSDQNFYVATEDGGEYVLKIFNFEESKNTALFEVQMQAMSFLEQNGMPVPTAVPTASRQITSLEEAGKCRVTTQACSRIMCLILTCVFITGVILQSSTTELSNLVHGSK